jgi:hypothetical protein
VASPIGSWVMRSRRLTAGKLDDAQFTSQIPILVDVSSAVPLAASVERSSYGDAFPYA